jgi:hypothetical protein
MTTERAYYALAVDTNDQGAWSLQIPVGTADGTSTGISRDTLRGVISPGRISVAICYGDRSPNDPILQCGPVWTYAADDGSQSNLQPNLTLGGAGIWSLFKARITVPGTWNVSMGFADTRSVATYSGSPQAIAIAVLNDMLTRGSLPIDVPAAAASSLPPMTLTYYGYDMTRSASTSKS